MLRLKSVKVGEWPEVDRELWLAARDGPFDIDDDCPAEEWRPATLANCEFFYGQYLRYHRDRGWLAAASNPLERARMDWIKEFAAAYSEGHAATSCAQILVSIAMLVRACHPPLGNPALTAYAYLLQDRAKPMTPKITRMASIAELEDLGEFLIDFGRERIAEGFQTGKIDFRDGLIISMLADHPIRRSNFAALQFGVSLFLEADRLVSRIDAEDTKGGWPIERRYRPRMMDWVREYANEVRPLFRSGVTTTDHGFMWLGKGGQPLDPATLLNIVKRHTKRQLGRTVPVHLFRDSVATDIAMNDPLHVGITRVILSHRTFDTTEKHYILAETSSACARYDQALSRRRRKFPVQELLKP